MIPDASFEWTENVVVLNSIAGKNVHAAVVHSGRHAHNHGAIGPAQARRYVGIDLELVGGDIKLPYRHSFVDMTPSRVTFPLSGRPTHLAAAEQMIVHVKNALSRVRACIDDDAKTALGQAMVAGQSPRYLEDPTDQSIVVRFEIEDTDDMLSWNN